MSTRSIQCIQEAWGIAHRWRNLVADSPMQSPEWMLTWWNHFGNPNRLELVVAEMDGHECFAFAPFMVSKNYGHQRIEMLGGGHVCTDYSHILASNNSDQLLARVVERLRELCFERPAFWSSELVIDGVREDHESTKRLCKHFEQCGFSIWKKPIESSYRLELPNTWNEYLASLSQSGRRKAKKVAAKFDSGDVTFHSTTDVYDINWRIIELEVLHQSRRQALGQPGSYSVKNFSSFLREAVDLLALQGKIRIEWCEHRGNVVAMHLLLLGSDTVYMYQSGVAPEYMDLEPGHCLTLSAIRNAIESGAKSYDFLRGDEPYKTYWGGKRIPLVKLSMHPPRLLSQIVGKTHEKLWNWKQSSGKAMSKFASAIAFEKT